MSEGEYIAKFNGFSHFAPVYVANDEIRMELFKHGLKGKLKEVVAGHSYANFQEMYQKMVKIVWVVDENKVIERVEVQGKRKFGSKSSSPQFGRNPKRFNSRQF